MIRNYFKIALRGFRKHKLFTLINITGLLIGTSAAIVIYLVVHFELTFDKFHKDGDRIYRVVSDNTYQGEVSHLGGVCGPLPAAVKSQATGIDIVAPFFTLDQTNVFVADKAGAPETRFKDQLDVVLAGPEYFKLFNYAWLAGTANSALDAPNQVVLASEQAKKYFPGLSYGQMIGKVVSYDSIKTTVTGIVQTLTQNSDLTFHDFISYSTGTTVKDLKNLLQLNEWGGTNSASQLFIKLSPTASAAGIEKQLNFLRNKYSPPKPENKGNINSFSLQPLSDLHFNGDYGSFDNGRIASKKMLDGLLVIAAFLLLLGCINFINLTTAQANQRAKEIGIRKTMGSSRAQLIFQFLSETFIITLIAVALSAALAPVVLKLFSDFIAPGVKVDILHQPDLIVFLFGLVVIVSLLSGFYPAMMLSGYKPVSVLKNQVTSTTKSRKTLLRKSLSVAQFVIAQFFIMATVLVSKQIYYALHKDLGFKKDAIITVVTPAKSRTEAINHVLFNKLSAMPQVELVSIGGAPPSSGHYYSIGVTYLDGKKEVTTDVQLKFGDENYMKLYKLKVLAGRGLQAGDTSKNVVINETYAKMLGFKAPASAVGTMLNHFYGGKAMQIVGVVGDFHHKSLREPIKPLAILTGKGSFTQSTFHIALKPETAGGEWKATIAGIQKTWKDIYPDDDFEYQFFDETIAKFYESELHTSTLLTWATGLSIFISCLGLLGLAIFTTGQRTKEIGVRKVLGASVAQVVTLLSSELIILIVLSFIIVTPIAWYAMNQWMQGFADRTIISWWIFAISGGVMLIAAILTSSFQTVKAALANPVKSLRSE